MINKQYRLSQEEADIIQKYRDNTTRNILVIGDLHAPFIKKGYLEHCLEVYNKYSCNQVILIGDLIDNHFSSYHETDPDGYSAGEELDRAISHLQPWFKAFPVADVCIGNHDAIVCRKAMSSGVSNRWLRDYDEVLGTPGWTFDDHFIYDEVYYTHGTGSSGLKAAYNRMVNWGMSVVQGHLHTESSIMWKVDKDKRCFAVQTGVGVSDKAYAMAYAKNFTKKYIISCAVILDNGEIPVIIPQKL